MSLAPYTLVARVRILFSMESSSEYNWRRGGVGLPLVTSTTARANASAPPLPETPPKNGTHAKAPASLQMRSRMANSSGVFSLARIYETEGVNLTQSLTAEAVRDRWGEISAEAGQKAYFNGGEQGQKVFARLAG